ncbi:hypothetical protein ABN028_09565 [Actinopolymorpha sp. B17G11]|uniref:tetratricopeptide repeat protein n=1 Tax=Actinopolymorpha sp. B17G11 TaxID=3160861 RepID=UPI0032E3ECE5
MEAGAISILMRAAGSLAQHAGRNFLRRYVLEFKVARRSSKEAAREGIHVSARSIRRWLVRPDTAERLRKRNRESIEILAKELAWVVNSPRPASDDAAVKLMYIIMRTYLEELDGGAAHSLSFEWQAQQIEHEGSQTRAAIDASEKRVLDRLDVSNDFEESLRSLPLADAVLARELRAVWPGVERAVAALADTAQRRALLDEWATSVPDYVREAPANAYCWLGGLSGTYGGSHAADFYDLGLRNGAFPRAYWLARKHLQHSADEAKALLDLEPERSGHPLAAALYASLHGDQVEALREITAWEPTRTGDKAIRGVLRAKLHAHQGEHGLALSVASETWTTCQSTAAACLAAELTLRRAVRAGFGSRSSDALVALDLATRARNLRRSWALDSAVECTVLAIRSAVVAGDLELAWRLSQPTPEGEATPLEAASDEVRAEGALAAAISGRQDRARNLLQYVRDGFAVAYISAVLMDIEVTEEGQSGSERIAAWRRASDAADTELERLQATMGLAEAGGTLPDLTDLAERYPEVVDEIQLIARVAAGGVSELKANVYRSRSLVVRLADLYTAEGDLEAAADTLKEGASRWSDLLLLSMAARKYQAAGLIVTARETALDCLSQAPAEWPGKRSVYELLVEVHAAEGNWHSAVGAARSLLEIDPQDTSSRWALVRCLVGQAALDAAWDAMSHDGSVLRPRSRDEALLWVSMCARYSTAAGFITEALDLMRLWPEDEELMGVFLRELYAGRRNSKLDDMELKELHSATHAYVAQFPESPVFRMEQVDLEGTDPLAPFEEELRRQYEATEDISVGVREGRLPLATLSSAVGRSYCEASIRRAAGVVYAVDPATEAEEIDAISNGASSRVVVDPTALHTLALLRRETVEVLLGAHRSAVTTDHVLKDALRARDALAFKSTMSVAWSPISQGPIVTTMSTEDADALAERSEEIVRLTEGLPRISWPELRHFPDLDESFVWLSALDLAQDRGWSYWADDRVIRQLARSVGVATFGSVALLRYLARNHSLSDVEFMVAESELIRSYYVELDFSRETMEMAAAADGWRARGAAAVLTRPKAWADPDAVMGFVHRVLDKIAMTALDELGGWVSAVSNGLVCIADTPTSATSNLAVLLRGVLVKPWLGPAQFRAVMEGVRSSFSQKPGMDDPLPSVLGEVYRGLVSRFGHSTAATLLMALVADSNMEDRALAARTVLLQKR